MKLLLVDSRRARLQAVLLFQVRTLLDALDGKVVRLQTRQRAIVSATDSYGWAFDGLCDAIGFGLFLLGVHRLLANRVRPEKMWLPLNQVEGKLCSMREQRGRQQRTRHACQVACFATLLLLGSIGWNRYTICFDRLLLSPATHHLVCAQADGTLADKIGRMEFTISKPNFRPPPKTRQKEMLSSSWMWTLIWCWKLLNPQMQMQLLMLSLLVNRPAVSAFD